MKNFKRIIVAVALALAVALPSSAQFRFGVKAGVAINQLKFNQEAFDASNRAGFTGGVMAEFTLPIIGIGADASVLYARRSSENVFDEGTKVINRDYIDIPLNLKWKIGLPIVGKIVSPFITTGPDFSFLCSKKNFENAIHSRTFDFSWNVGLGLQLVNKLQVAANYGIGISQAASGEDSMNGGLDLKGKNRVWTITAAFLF